MKIYQKGFVSQFIIVLIAGAAIYFAFDYIKKDQAPALIEYRNNGVIERVSCGSKGCFDINFAMCQPAVLQVDAGEQAGTVEYKITGRKDGKCYMAFRYLKLPSSPGLINKGMICEVDTKYGYDSAWRKVLSEIPRGIAPCTGTLHEILRTQ